MCDEDTANEPQGGADGWLLTYDYAPFSTVQIRENDYYGGDVWVDVQPESAFEAGCVVLRWRSWGAYGASALQLSVTEAELLARIISAADLRRPAPDNDSSSPLV